MSSLNLVPFLDLADDVSAGSPKVPRSDYLAAGRHPVIDQGEGFIGGYVDRDEWVSKVELPVVLFGDHTRRFKFVDIPFCVGADGVKILRAKPGVDPRFLYHQLRSLDLPNAGYSRHYKFLTRTSLTRPPIEEQRRIAAILDKADDLRAKRRAALTQLDTLTQAIFTDMFGDVDASVPLGEIVSIPLRNGTSPATAGTVLAKVLTLSAITGRGFRSDAVKEVMFTADPTIERGVTRQDLLICRGNGNPDLVGRGWFPVRDMPDVAFPDTMIAARVPAEAMCRRFLEVAWSQPAVRTQIAALARTTNGTFKVNQEALGAVRVPLPPVAEQQRFETAQGVVDRQRIACETSLSLADDLFASLESRAFAGAL